MKYVLITAARNEEAFIRLTLASVAAQTQLPERWIITDDGSTDCTAEIVEAFARPHPWITLVRESRVRRPQLWREGRRSERRARANAATGV